MSNAIWSAKSMSTCPFHITAGDSNSALVVRGAGLWGLCPILYRGYDLSLFEKNKTKTSCNFRNVLFRLCLWRERI